MWNLFFKLFVGYRSKPGQTRDCQLSLTTSSLTHLLPISQSFSLCTPFPGSFFLLLTHGYFISPVFEQNPLAMGQTLFLFLCMKAIGLSPFWHPSYSILQCFENSVKNSPLQTILQRVIKNLVFFLLQTFQPSLTPIIFLGCLCVHACLYACACVWCVRCTIDCLLFLRFYVYVFVDLVKSGLLTLVGEVWHNRNDCNYY